MNPNIPLIKTQLEKLRELDKHCLLFGAEHHSYTLKAPLSEAAVATFEKRCNIKLPEDYRDFLIHLGNGGAGPAYGMAPLKPTNGVGTPFLGVKQLRKKQHAFSWEQERKMLLEHHAEALTQVYGELSQYSTKKLFELCEELNLPMDQNYEFYQGNGYYWEQDREKLLKEIKEVLDWHFDTPEEYLKLHTRKLFQLCDELDIPLNERDYRHYPDYAISFDDDYIYIEDFPITGIVHAFYEGCGHAYMLVVNGADYGKVIFVGNEKDMGLTNSSFTEYYLYWLNNHIDNFEYVRGLMHKHPTLDAVTNEAFKKNVFHVKDYALGIMGVAKPTKLFGSKHHKIYGGKAQNEWYTQQFEAWKAKQ